MKIDRDLQRNILQFLADVYPASSTVPSVACKGAWQDAPESYRRQVANNLLYLSEHELVAFTADRSLGLDSNSVLITAKGLDFLEDDGGLTAILNTVTVKFDAENLRDFD